MVEDRIVVEPERKTITKVGRSKWHELEAEGLVPQRRQLVGQRTGWLLSELLDWVRTRPLASNSAPAAALAARGISVHRADDDAAGSVKGPEAA